MSRKIADVGGPERPVKRGPLVGPYMIEEIFGATEPSAREEPPQSSPQAQEALGHSGDAAPLSSLPIYLRGVKDAAGLASVGSSDSYGSSDPAQIAARCEQFQNLLKATAQGHDPLIGWYPYMGVLAFCGDEGLPYAKNLATDAKWIATIEEKIERWQEKAAGPTTCAHFSSLDPAPCLRCPHYGRITSPIQLGRDLPPTQLAPAPSAFALPPLPKGFLWSGMRLCAERTPTDEDKTTFQVITEYPVVISQLQEMERSQHISAVFRSWEPMQGDWREFVLNLGEVMGQGGLAKVADQGVVVQKKRWDRFTEYVGGAANEHRGTKHYGVRYEQFGWKKGPAFLLGDALLRPGAAPEHVHGSNEVERRGGFMKVQGHVSAWTEAADRLIAGAGLEAQTFMLLCAFAAPLYHFTGAPGVTLVHGATRETAKGKTTIQEAGASIWGEPAATSIIERDTMVAKFITLGTLCNLPVFFDELRFPTAEETKHYVLQTTLGRDKQRGRAEGGLRTDQLDWSTIHISASNLSLVDTVRADGAETAQAARVFEFGLTLPADVKMTEGEALKLQMQENCGTAGRIFIQFVLDNYEWVQATVEARMRHYEKTMQAGPEERFIIRLFACVDVAGAVVRAKNLLHCDLSQVMAWAGGVQHGNAGRLAAEAQMDAGAIVSQMLNDMKPSHLLVVDRAAEVGKPHSMHVHVAPKTELWMRFEFEGRKVLLDIVAVRKWMQEHHYSFTTMQRELQNIGILKEVRTRRTLGAGTPYGLGQTWCWFIDGMHPLLTDALGEVIQGDNVVHLRREG